MERLKLKEAIKQAGYTQSEVASKVNISHSYLRQVVGGFRNPSLRTTREIMRLLEIDDIRIMDKN